MLKSGLEDVKAAKAKPRAMGAAAAGDDPDGQPWAPCSRPRPHGKLATNPATRGFLAQPDFMAMLSEVQKNPDTFAIVAHRTLA